MPPVLLEKIERFGFDFSEYCFNADKGYDFEKNYELFFRMGVIPKSSG